MPGGWENLREPLERAAGRKIMLLSLHVKNLALIREAELSFGRGLNILTGETGAGKSVLIGSVNLALGGRFEKEMLRRGAESALVELEFDCDQARVREKLAELEIPLEDTVRISRRMQAGRSVLRINGEPVNVRQVKELAELLLDVHGQHEHQSLLHKKKHLEILDAYCGDESLGLRESAEALFCQVRELERRIREETLDPAALGRERSLAEFECQEIEDARLRPGEDQEAEARYRKLANSQRIMEALGECHRYAGNDGEAGAGSAIGRAVRGIGAVAEYDDALGGLLEQLSEIETLLSDFNRDLSDYMADLEFDGEDFQNLEDRLNLINRLKEKYGGSIEEILEAGKARQERLDQLADYDRYMEGLRDELARKKRELSEVCGELTKVRRRCGAKLEEELTQSLVHLNFLTVRFQIAIRPLEDPGPRGGDDVEFLIALNPGEDVKPLSQIASGGELSRIMLAIKTVLAGKDEIDTLIFDEIDAGISGRTAWKVSEQLSRAARAHQVICITHLPQIAAMADEHFLIEKNALEDGAVTDIRRLEQEESLQELARLLGSDSVSEAALTNARQMRNQALENKGSV